MVLSAAVLMRYDARRDAMMLAGDSSHGSRQPKMRISRELCTLSRVGFMNQAAKESSIGAKGGRCSRGGSLVGCMIWDSIPAVLATSVPVYLPLEKWSLCPGLDLST